MSQTVATLIPAAVDYERTLILAIEVSNKSWVLAAQVPGLPHRTQSIPGDPRERRRCSAWRYGAVYKEWCRSLGALPSPNAGQWSGSTPWWWPWPENC